MPDILIEPKDCALVLVDQQAGLAFGVGSMDRNMLLKDVIVLARTATI
jgi:nicotinamidase-related amidase